MKKFLLIILGIIGTVVLIAVIGTFLFVSNIDSVIKTTAVNVVPPMTKTEFSVGDIHTEPTKGKVEIIDLYLGNPEGFPEGHALKFDKIVTQIDWKSLMKDKLIIKALVVNGLDIYLEKEGDKKSNLEIILTNVEDYLTKLAEEQELVDQENLKEASEQLKVAKRKLPKRFQIDLFEIKDAHVLAQVQKGVDVSAKVEIPEFKIENLGVDGKGLTLEQLIKQVFVAIVKEVDVAVEMGKSAQKEKEGEKKAENDKKKEVGGMIEGFLKQK